MGLMGQMGRMRQRGFEAAGQGGMTVVAGGQGGVAAVIAVVVGWGSWWCFLMGLCLMLQS